MALHEINFSLYPSLIVISYIILIIYRGIYRLFFHPLAGFPGPKLAALTKWYERYFELVQRPGGQYFREVDRMHDRYGPVVRINPDEIHVRDPTWYDSLYVSNSYARDKYPPAANMAGTPLAAFGTVNHELHLKRRAALAPIFSKRAIQESEPLIKKHIKLLVALFENSVISCKPLSLETTFLAFSTDFIGSYAFNLDFNLLKDAEAAADWRKTLDSVAVSTVAARQFPWLIYFILSIPRALVRPFFPDICRLLDAYAKIADSAVTHISTRTLPENKSNLNNIREQWRPSTLFHAIDKSSLPPQEKVLDRLLQEGIVLLFAGGETVAHALSHIVFHLLDNPDIYDRIKTELDEATSPGELIPSLHTLERLPWLSASIREGLRLASPVSSRLPQVARSELHYHEWTPISMNPSSVLRDPAVYSNPYKFAPDRWFNASDYANRCFVPFGKGARMCQGLDLAYAEMFLTIATLLRTFKLELFDTYRERDIELVRDHFTGFPAPGSPGVRVLVRNWD